MVPPPTPSKSIPDTRMSELYFSHGNSVLVKNSVSAAVEMAWEIAPFCISVSMTYVVYHTVNVT